MAADVASLSKKYGISTDQVSSLIKGSNTAYGDKVLKNLQSKGTLGGTADTSKSKPSKVATPAAPSASSDSGSLFDFTKSSASAGQSLIDSENAAVSKNLSDYQAAKAPVEAKLQGFDTEINKVQQSLSQEQNNQ